MSQPKTILYTLGELEYSGVLTYTQHCIKCAQEMDCKIIVLAFTGDQIDFDERRVKLITVTKAKVKIILFNRICNLFNYYYHFFKILVQEKPDVIHFAYFLPLALTPRLIKAKKIITFHGNTALQKFSSIKEVNFFMLLKLKIINFWQRRAFNHADQIIVLSNYAKRSLKKDLLIKENKRIKKITGTFLSENQQKLKKNIDKKNILRLLYFGRFESRKGVKELLDMAKILQDKQLNFVLQIAGPTYNGYFYELFKYYEKLNLFTCVQFLHRFNQEQKKQLLSNIDLVIMPSQKLETFGLTVLEATSQGIAVLTTPVGALPEIMKNIAPQLLSKNISARSLAIRVLEFANLSKIDRQQLTEQLIIKTNQHYAFANFAKKMKKIYEI